MSRIMILCLVLLGIADFARAGCVALFEFEIEDQFETPHTQAEVLGAVTILVWADREGSDFLEIWGAALDSVYGESAVVRRGVAHVEGVPGWIPGLKGKIRGSFSREPEQWTLMDWKGRFAAAYRPTPGTVNLLVLDAQGCLQGRVSGPEPNRVLLDALAEMVGRASGSD